MRRTGSNGTGGAVVDEDADFDLGATFRRPMDDTDCRLTVRGRRPMDTLAGANL